MRLKNAFKNSLFGMLAQIIIIIFGIVLQRVLVQTLTKELIGLNSVFGNIISILSLSEMGVASAIVYNLYKPIAEGDENMICRLMTLFKTAYRAIAGCVLILGLVVTPFVHIFVDDSGCDRVFVRLVFLLFTAKTSLSYLFSYKRSLLTANQKSYILTVADVLARTVNMGVSIAVLILTRSIVWYLCVAAVTTTAENIIVSSITDRMYPYVKRHERTDAATAKKVFGDVGNIFVGKVSATVLNSTDYIIISSFTGVVSAALYYNYNLIINSVLQVLQKLLTGTQASIGDLFTEGNSEKNYDILRQLSFIFFWLGAVCGVCLLCLLDDFVVNIWLDGSWQLPLNIVALCVLVFFLINVRGPLWSMVSVSGLFSRDKYISITGAVANIVISLVLVASLDNSTEYMWGMFGVFSGTLISQTIQLIMKTRLLFRYSLERSPRRYVLDMVEYFAVFFVLAAGSYLLCALLPDMNGWLSIILKACVALAVPNAAIILLYHRSGRFLRTMKLVKYFLKRREG